MDKGGAVFSPHQAINSAPTPGPVLSCNSPYPPTRLHRQLVAVRPGVDVAKVVVEGFSPYEYVPLALQGGCFSATQQHA